jgi:hypothetical protein
MSRTTYVLRDGQLVPKNEVRRPWLHGVIPDGMDATECPADGKVYESRSAYYRAVKNAGCEILGSTEALPQPRRSEGPSVEQSMRQAWQRLNPV